MPESKGRKPRKQPAKKAVPRKSPLPRSRHEPDFTPVDMPAEARRPPPSRSPIREIEPEPLPTLPEPARYDEVMVAVSQLDPLSQEAMLAQRIAAMPSQAEGGMPVNIHRAVRGPWASQLRKLGVFVIPELATHELVPNAAAGIMANHAGRTLEKITPEKLLQTAKEHNPELAALLDQADTPAKRRKAMAELYDKLPVAQRIALQRLESHDPEDFTPR